MMKNNLLGQGLERRRTLFSSLFLHKLQASRSRQLLAWRLHKILACSAQIVAQQLSGFDSWPDQSFWARKKSFRSNYDLQQHLWRGNNIRVVACKARSSVIAICHQEAQLPQFERVYAFGLSCWQVSHYMHKDQMTIYFKSQAIKERKSF